jgi:hypothetical protein
LFSSAITITLLYRPGGEEAGDPADNPVDDPVDDLVDELTEGPAEAPADGRAAGPPDDPAQPEITVSPSSPASPESAASIMTAGRRRVLVMSQPTTFGLKGCPQKPARVIGAHPSPPDNLDSR